ncbi:tubulin binding cofactor A [Syncephalis plumigaleata]|nr:tubulin binding cofactor A [Syncephalis plumigaleata]
MAERELKIKTSALKRLVKDYRYYVSEASAQTTKIEELVAENADPYVVKKQREVLDDTLQMFPDTQRRISEMREKVTSLLNDPSVVDEEIKTAAQEALTEAENASE